MREIKYRAVFLETNVVSVNSFTIHELSSHEEHEWEFSDGSSLPANDVCDGDLEYLEYALGGIRMKIPIEELKKVLPEKHKPPARASHEIHQRYIGYDRAITECLTALSKAEWDFYLGDLKLRQDNP